jgi:HD-GYP domain-containing protein (c-di-GMP phosphodiesterase class II)
LAFYAERQGVKLTQTTELTISSLPCVFAAVVFGPLAAMTVGVLGVLSQFGRPHLRWAVWTGSRSLSGGAAGLAAMVVGSTTDSRFGAVVAAAVAAAMTEAVADLVLGAATVLLRRSASVREVVVVQAPLLLAAVPLYAPIIGILAFAYFVFSPWSVVLFVIPAFAAQRLFLMYREQRAMAKQLTAVNHRLENANLSFATALVATVEARDRYTAGHSAAVAVYSRDIAARMGLSDSEQRLAHLCGLVHDVGKVGLAPGLLEKPGALTLEERRQMERHSEIGERILAKVEDYREIATIVRHHHERWDGQGYPDGLARKAIPLISRIIAVADAYNAMTSDRPYRDAMPSRVARLRLAQAADSQFDTSVVAAFEAILASSTETYRRGHRADFKLEAQDRYSSPLPVAAVG